MLSIIILPFQVLFSRMPPTRRQKHVASSSTTTGSQANEQRQASAPRHSLRSHANRVESSATTISAATVVATPAPAPSAGPSSLPGDLLATLVSSVTAAVTEQISALLPTYFAAPAAMSDTPPPTTSPAVPSASSTSATALVNDALAEVHSNISGQTRPCTIPEPSLPQQPFHSASLPLDAGVPDKIKAKIWKEEFVDFSVLLSNPDPTTHYEINVRPSETGQPASVVLEPAAKPNKQIKNINDWLRAFHIFVSIYTLKYPHESYALMKYGQVVQDLAACEHNWYYYDEHFRFLRVPWAFHDLAMFTSTLFLARTLVSSNICINKY